MRENQLNTLMGKLQAQLNRYSDALSVHKELGFEDSLKDSTGDLSSYDNHPADMASETYELEKQFALTKHNARQIDEVRAALERMKNGEYGFCEFCGREISYKRLDVLPAARLCMECESERKVKRSNLEHDRPVEEERLMTPFARTFTDDTSSVVYDGEDAFQETQRYGSSSGPQDISVNELIDYDHTFYESYEDRGYVEDVESISNATYRQQLPDSHGNSYDGYVDPDKEVKIDYFGEDEPE